MVELGASDDPGRALADLLSVAAFDVTPIATEKHTLTHRKLLVTIVSGAVPRQPLVAHAPYERFVWHRTDALDSLAISTLARKVLSW